MISITLNIPDKRIADMLCSGLESGSGYWATILEDGVNVGDKDVLPWGDAYTPSYMQAPFCTSGSVVIEECLHEGDSPKRRVLDRAALTKGLTIMAEKWPAHFGDFLAENDDAETGDVFLQCCLLGEVIYG